MAREALERRAKGGQRGSSVTRKARHGNLRAYFGANGVSRERSRYARDVTGVYRQALIERFLERHAGGSPGPCLEIGPGPGRFTRSLAQRYADLYVLDISSSMLKACRRVVRANARTCRPTFVEGTAESLPFERRSFDRVIALGVLLFVSREFPRVLKDLARLLKPGGRLVFEIQAPSQAIMSVLPPNPSGARTILGRPREFHLWSVVRDGFQPHDPRHWARFEVIWKRPKELTRDVAAANLRVLDTMAIAPNFGNQPTLLKAIRRDPAAFATALDIEEETGRWPELWGAGAGTLVAATIKA